MLDTCCLDGNPLAPAHCPAPCTGAVNLMHALLVRLAMQLQLPNSNGTVRQLLAEKVAATRASSASDVSKDFHVSQPRGLHVHRKDSNPSLSCQHRCTGHFRTFDTRNTTAPCGPMGIPEASTWTNRKKPLADGARTSQKRVALRSAALHQTMPSTGWHHLTFLLAHLSLEKMELEYSWV